MGEEGSESKVNLLFTVYKACAPFLALYFRHLTQIHDNLTEWILFPFYRQENQRAKRVSNIFKVTELQASI